MFNKLTNLKLGDFNELGAEIYLIIIGAIVALAVVSIIITTIVKNKRK